MLFVWDEKVQAVTPSVIACGDATFPKGTALAAVKKVSGIAIRRPLGGAGCERSEQTEGVLPGAPERALMPPKTTRKPVFQRTYVNKMRISKNCKIF